MLSIEKCREILGKYAADLSDKEIITMREYFYFVVNSALDSYIETKHQNFQGKDKTENHDNG